MLAGLDFHIGPSKEIAIVGPSEPLVAILRQHYIPRSVVAAGAGNQIPLLRDRPLIDGKATAYICENYTCQQPVTDPASFEKQLTEQ
jgi:uncharacterized protein YyaL (SSP411 family)